MTEQIEEIEGRDLTAKEEALLYAQARLSERDGLGIGLCGAHRTGKTSLCEHIAKKNPVVPFLRTSAKEAAKAYGFDVNNPGSFEERMGWQEYLLGVFEETYQKQNSIFIADRTPIDMAAYLLADVPAGDIDPELDRRVQTYVQRCIDMSDAHFGGIILVQPGIPFIAVDGSPAPNKAYQEKLNYLMRGLLDRTKRPNWILDRDMIDFQARANAIASIASEVISGYRILLNTMPRH